MITLQSITKVYTTGNFRQTALDEVSLHFRKSEFVAILGQSGSGKTTFLNVLGGLDRYDSGDLIINGRSTKNFKERDWDAYRNNSVGFIFQNYNLIAHLSIVDNVELGMTLSGVSAAEKHKKAKEVLVKVGLADHLHKKPGQLSGGQMQRVAIARALANDPDIILADEPTGALDTATSVQIMDLIREVAADKLVVMVTHNAELAAEYADRIVRFSDGRVVDDTNPPTESEERDDYRLKKTSMGFFTALKLSGKNIATKKLRTALTAFASSIGIIGVALVLSLSNGFDMQIKDFETGALSNYPITIAQSAMSVDKNEMSGRSSNLGPKYPDDGLVRVYDANANSVVHQNVLTADYLDYLAALDPALLDGVSYTRSVSMNMLKKKDGKVSTLNTALAGFSTYPTKAGEVGSAYLEQYYDLVGGTFPKEKTDLVLVVDQYNRLDKSVMSALGLSEDGSVTAESLVGTEYRLVMNDDYYKKVGQYFMAGTDLDAMYQSASGQTLRITGVIRIKEGASVSTLSKGVAYSDDLAKEFIADAEQSAVVKAQRAADYNVLTGAAFPEQTGEKALSSRMMGMMQGSSSQSSEQPDKDTMLTLLGASSTPSSISLYPKDFDAKEKITAYLDAFNDGKAEADQVQYIDMAAMLTTLSGGIMSGITIVLVAFAGISLVVSMIMIGIIIYISVLERTREIGVLRALGARKKDISRVFNAETFLIGAFSGILGITLTYLLCIPVNAILYSLTELSGVAQLNPLHAVLLVLISITLTMIGGLIPARYAAKKDPVEALRSE